MSDEGNNTVLVRENWEEEADQETILAQKMSKATLNVHAKEFKPNVHAKEFVPSWLQNGSCNL